MWPAATRWGPPTRILFASQNATLDGRDGTTVPRSSPSPPAASDPSIARALCSPPPLARSRGHPRRHCAPDVRTARRGRSPRSPAELAPLRCDPVARPARTAAPESAIRRSVDKRGGAAAGLHEGRVARPGERVRRHVGDTPARHPADQPLAAHPHMRVAPSAAVVYRRKWTDGAGALDARPPRLARPFARRRHPAAGRGAGRRRPALALRDVSRARAAWQPKALESGKRAKCLEA
jgi:hypothetical protein